MFRKDIEQAFTNKVAEYFARGYNIYYTSMGGHQGELAKVDLTNGKEIVRIFLDSNNEYGVKVDNRRVDLRYISLIVGRCVDKNVRIGCRWDVIWSEKLEIISEIRFYEIGRRDNNFFGTREEAIAATLKSYDRTKYKMLYDTENIIFGEKAKNIVLSFVKKQYKCKSVTLKQIEQVKKIIYYKNGKVDSVRYYVVARGNNYRLH